MAQGPWEFWIDRGGTFTDCIGLAPDGALHTAKLLSCDDAPLAGMRAILERAGALAPGAPLPPCSVKLGTTVATNALLERRGVRTLLVTNPGLGDVAAIGTQQRPELFALHIVKPSPLHERVLELAGRVDVDGGECEALDPAAARAALVAARRDGLASLAVVRIHAYAHPEHERRLAQLAREAGFEDVSASHEVACEMGLLARMQTTLADAYLTPLLRRHAEALSRALPGSRLRFMQSSGGLSEAARFRGAAALLSGPAGGVVGAARVAAQAGFASAIAFDMGGTSTDVSLLVGGEVEHAFETRVAGLELRAPMLRIHTVAAGGGSLCRFDGIRLSVGPESAGADPGPLCYGRGAPHAAGSAGFTLTDANLLLGRLPPDRFPFPLHPERAAAALGALEAELRAAGHALDADGIAAGFVEVANASMAEAIRQVSVVRGTDPREHALVGFGGAAGQHVCAVARALGMQNVLLHPLAGLLSAYGIGLSDARWDGQRDAGRVALATPGSAALPAPVGRAFAELEAQGRAALGAEGFAASEIAIQRALDLRAAGSETALPVAEPADGDWAAAFRAAHAARFGYTREDRALEIVTLRVSARARPAAAPLLPPPPSGAGAAGTAPAPRRSQRAWFPGIGRCDAPVYDREALRPGHELRGPALVLEDSSTLVLDPGFSLRVGADGILRLRDLEGARRAAQEDLRRADPVRLEVFGNRFMSIAEQMGAVLRGTAVSTNIKERLDYSCALFDAEGGLVANAPHIPVHLGAMGETVRAVRAEFPDLAPGDVFVTNDPASGGTHLPDVTAVTPVFVPERREAAFFVASRGHHADIGGRTPGSMPADSRRLEEEGVLLRSFPLVRGGRFDEARLRGMLEGARYPARHPDDNVADLEAMVAANHAGVRLLLELVRERGLETVQASMEQLQRAAAQKVAREIARLREGEHRFEDQLDDGTPIRVRLRVGGGRMELDFEGTGAASPGNLNAPRAVVRAAVLYVLRCLVAERIPLNGGCLEPVQIRVPAGSLLDPPPGAAVVGGNVETSQRIVDVLLGALGLAAASQGTMNNVAFGDARFGYYETIAGGAGAGEGFDGASGVHTHMTNTRITDAEVIEARYPVRLEAFALRRGSGGRGRWRGGDGLLRRWRFLAPVTLSLLTERRRTAPFGLAGGAPGARGRNRVERRDGRCEELPSRASCELEAGDVLVIETPGGGGFGAPP